MKYDTMYQARIAYGFEAIEFTLQVIAMVILWELGWNKLGWLMAAVPSKWENIAFDRLLAEEEGRL